MPNIEAIVRQLNKDLVPQFEEMLRAYMEGQDREWLIEQIVRLTLDAHSKAQPATFVPTMWCSRSNMKRSKANGLAMVLSLP